MDFPRGGDIEATRTWLDKEGFRGFLTGWKADAILGLSEITIMKKVPGEKGEMLWGLLNTARQTSGARLRDGIPELIQNLSVSPPSVPPEKEHASCSRVVTPFPYIIPINHGVLNSMNTVWRTARAREDQSRYLLYSSEFDIAHFVRTFLEDILFTLNLPLNMSSEVTIKQVRPDMCVLLLGMYLVGVVEVKKPGCNVLLEPTVLGELLDQMLLVEGFYGMGPVLGILTTGEEWLVAWFRADGSALASGEGYLDGKAYTTPLKTAAASAGTKDNSPPGGTPSQQAGSAHTLDVADDIPADQADDNGEISEHMDRELCATEVLNIRTDVHGVLEVLCSAFKLMASARFNHRPGISRCLLKFHKNIQAVTFHPVNPADMYALVDYDRYPSKNAKSLVALEDLGRGSSGKAWLCVTVTKPRSAVCVLKFDNMHENSTNLRHEHSMWMILYPELSALVCVERWSGAEALKMPHFATVLENERELYREEVKEVLTRIARMNKVHKDVRWRNMGKYRHKNGHVVIVLYDLLSVVEYDAGEHDGWIDSAMMVLYADE